MPLNDLFRGQTAPNPTSPSTAFPQRGDVLSGAMVTELLPRYYEQASLGNIFTSYCNLQTLSVPGTAMTGNMIYNPPGSRVNLVMLKWTSQVVVTSATMTGVSICGTWQNGTPSTTTAATATGSTLISASTAGTSKAIAYSIATVAVAPFVIAVLHHNTAAIGTTGEDEETGDFEGSIVVKPGGFVCLAAIDAASAASAHTSSLMWMEVPAVA